MPKYCLTIVSSAFLAAVVSVSDAQAQSSDDEVEKRLLRLEEQMVDLSAQVGTLETLTKGGGLKQAPAAPPSAPGSVSAGSGDDRTVTLETQLNALSSQISDLIERISRIERGAGITPEDSGKSPPQPGVANNPSEQAATQNDAGALIEGDGTDGQQQGANDYSGEQQNQGDLNRDSGPIQTAAQSTPLAQSLYDEAYNELVQRNYREAAAMFRQFVEEFPTDPLAGQAFHWLGESAFVNGQYREAADSFLKSSTNYPQNQKAPESLLKLGISLKRLGETKAACSSFSELDRRFPQATDILKRAEQERKRAKC